MSWENIAAQVTLCNFGTTGAAFAASAAWTSAYTGQIWGTVGFGAASAALAAAAAASGCYDGEPDPPEVSQPLCCVHHSSPDADVVLVTKDTGSIGTNANWPQNWQYLHSAKDTGRRWPGSSRDNVYEFVMSNDGINKTTVEARVLEGLPNEGQCWSLRSPNGQCLDNAPPEPEPEPPEPPEPVPIIDPDTGCEWTVNMTDAYLNERGALVVQYTASSNDPSECGPDQVWWDEAGKGPTLVGPAPDGGPVPPPEPLPLDCPDPCAPCPDPTPPTPNLPPKNYNLTGVCEEVPEGQNQPRFDYNSAGGPYYQELANRIDNLALMFQKHLELKTPACVDSPPRPELKGSWVTTRWKSDEVMDHSGTRLRKLFRYRSQSTRDLKQLSDYWRDFTWKSGAVCVIHKGAWWGTPQVWAETADEGKRVIRFAAAEAGIDPDQTGEWTISSSSAPRFGMSGTMRIHVHEGFPWVASRDGQDWPNYLAK
jgi:hypothetical protein